MPAAVMADSAEAMAGTAADMPRQPMLGADTLAMSEVDRLVFAVGMAASMRGMREAMRAMLEAQVTGPAAVTGEAITGEAIDGGVITGEVITDIRTMDIPGTAWAIMDWATAIRMAGMAITDIVRGGGTILTDTDTRPT